MRKYRLIVSGNSGKVRHTRFTYTEEKAKHLVNELDDWNYDVSYIPVKQNPMCKKISWLTDILILFVSQFELEAE
jgi:hypothetical protein